MGDCTLSTPERLRGAPERKRQKKADRGYKSKHTDLSACRAHYTLRATEDRRKMILTRDKIKQGMKNGLGLSRKQAEILDIKYPIKKGWIDNLEGKEISEEQYQKYIELRDEIKVVHIKPSKKQKKKQTERFKRNFLDVNSNYCNSKTTQAKIKKIKYADLRFDRKEIVKSIRKMPYQEFLKTPYWKAISAFVKNSNGCKCVICGKESRLDVHHTNYKNHGNEINNIEDLIPLCRECHRKAHNIVPG